MHRQQLPDLAESGEILGPEDQLVTWKSLRLERRKCSLGLAARGLRLIGGGLERRYRKCVCAACRDDRPRDRPRGGIASLRI